MKSWRKKENCVEKIHHNNDEQNWLWCNICSWLEIYIYILREIFLNGITTAKQYDECSSRRTNGKLLNEALSGGTISILNRILVLLSIFWIFHIVWVQSCDFCLICKADFSSLHLWVMNRSRALDEIPTKFAILSFSKANTDNSSA